MKLELFYLVKLAEIVYLSPSCLQPVICGCHCNDAISLKLQLFVDPDAADHCPEPAPIRIHSAPAEFLADYSSCQLPSMNPGLQESSRPDHHKAAEADY